MKAFSALLSAAWQYSAGRRMRLGLYVAMFVLANIVLLLEPIVIGALLNTIQEIQKAGSPFRTLGTLFACMIAIQAGFWLFHGPARVLERITAFHAKNSFADRLFGIVTALPVQWHRDHHSGQTINRMRKATNALYDFMESGYQLIEMVMRLLGSVTAIFILFPIAGVIAVVISLLAVVVVFLFDRVLLPQYDAINEREHFTASALHDYLTNVFTVISLRLERLTRTELWKRMNAYLPLYMRNAKLNETKWFLATIIISIMTVSVLAWYAGATLISGGTLLAGTVYMLYDYLQKIGSAFYTFAWKYSQTVQQYADLRAVREIFEASPSAHGEGKLPRAWKRIEIRNLRFSYEDAEHQRHHVQDVHLILERGKRIALIGSSGSGKSTIMSLIRGLHTADSAEVTCDGKPLKNGLRAVGSNATLIPQEPEIFANTIEYNISVDTEQSREELDRDVKLACFDAVLARLPQGLHTDISEKGVNLSGGEKQRLALARGIFAAKDSAILLLDEPTSSVDPANELRIYRNIFEHFGDRCIVSSIHRLHLLPMFDEIYLLEEGRVTEHGSFQALLSLAGTFAELWASFMEEREREGQKQ